MKYLTFLLLAMALAACDLGASSPSAEPLPSVGTASMEADHSMDAGMSMDASADASSMTGMTCDEAVAALDPTVLSEMASLDAASDALDDTIASCASVTDWETTVSDALPLLDLTSAETFLAGRCAANATLADTPICGEVTM